MIPSITKNITVAPTAKSTASNAIALAVVLIVACGLVTWFLILPKRAEIKTQQDQKDVQEAQEVKVAKDLKNLQNLGASLKGHEADNAKLDQDLPLDAKTFDLKALIQNLASSVNVTVGDISVSSKSDFVIAGNIELLKNPFGGTRTMQKTTGNITVTFAQLEAFIRKIESSARILDISDLEITSGQKSQLGLRLGINAYYLAQ
jgi:Tfp pilus assembly protein PilO